MKRIIHVSLQLLCTLCVGGLMVCCDRSSSPDFDQPPLATQSIRLLKARSVEQATRLTEEIRIEGIVTADDLFGEWERQLVIEDPSGGICIALDDRQLYRRFPRGTTLSISCNGLILHRIGGMVILGGERDAYGNIALDEEHISRHIHRTSAVQIEPQPTPCTITALNSAMADRYLRIDDLHFTEQASWCATDPLTHRFVPTIHIAADRAGNQLMVYAHPTLTYADEPLPEGNGSLWGIAELTNEGMRLRVVHRQYDF